MSVMGLLVLTSGLVAPLGAWASSPVAGTDPYQSFARSPQGARLLIVARNAMRAHWGEHDTARESAIPWPAAPRGIYVTLTDGTGTRACVGNAAPYRGGLIETVRVLAV